MDICDPTPPIEAYVADAHFESLSKREGYCLNSTEKKHVSIIIRTLSYRTLKCERSAIIKQRKIGLSIACYFQFTHVITHRACRTLHND